MMGHTPHPNRTCVVRCPSAHAMHASQAKSSLSKSSQVKSSMRREVRICLAISKPGTTVSRSPLVSPGLPWSSARSLSPLTVVTRDLVRIWVLSRFHIWVLSQFHIWVLSQFHIWVLSQVPLPKITLVHHHRRRRRRWALGMALGMALEPEELARRMQVLTTAKTGARYGVRYGARYGARGRGARSRNATRA